MSGKFPCNFKIEFDDGATDYLLRLDDYATSVTAGRGSWCLASEDRRKRGGRSKAPVKAVVAEKMNIELSDLQAMDHAQRQKLFALLKQADGGA